ncbi:metal-sulfur cluster assembly factor [uncultured Lutibacter sp.]|uniref:metal-sulfur cluster assembly factor n=1 Tax=uncultured Lutibacter sp. TaxID=437739 RepID=UPI002628701D|nr:metal-sulfur cluster assembly factor [uncultured Lutibacter sp.]
MNKEQIKQFEEETLVLLKNVMDPEIEINIVDLGLIYELYYDGNKKINIVMTFSTPACPLGETIKTDIIETIKQQHPDFITIIDVVFYPEWNTTMVSEAGKKVLGM